MAHTLQPPTADWQHPSKAEPLTEDALLAFRTKEHILSTELRLINKRLTAALTEANSLADEKADIKSRLEAVRQELIKHRMAATEEESRQQERLAVRKLGISEKHVVGKRATLDRYYPSEESATQSNVDVPRGVLHRSWAHIQDTKGRRLAVDVLHAVGKPMTLTQIAHALIADHMRAGVCTDKDFSQLVNRITSNVWYPNYHPIYDNGPGNRGLTKAEIAPFVFQDEARNKRGHYIKHYVLRSWVRCNEQSEQMLAWHYWLNQGPWSKRPGCLETLTCKPHEMLLDKYLPVPDVHLNGREIWLAARSASASATRPKT